MPSEQRKETVRLALAQYAPSAFADWREYVAKVTGWVLEAVGNGAEMLVFPEYGALELASLLAPEQRPDYRAELRASFSDHWRCATTATSWRRPCPSARRMGGSPIAPTSSPPAAPSAFRRS